MLPQHLRLRRPSDFARLRAEGQAYHHRWLLLSVLPNDTGHNRYGFITSRALGNAVTRNRAKRQLREAIRQVHPQLVAGYDVVIVARKSIVAQPSNKIQRTVYELARRASLIKQDEGL